MVLTHFLSRHLYLCPAFVLTLLLLAAPATATLNPFPLARPNGIGVTMVAYGPQVPQTSTLVALSPIIVVSDSESIAALHAANPSLCALSYLNPNLTYYYPYYAEAQRTETAFLHAGDPAYLSASSSPGSLLLSWLPDARVGLGFFSVTGYQVWRRTGTSDSFQLVTTTAPTVTQFTDSGLTDGVHYSYVVKSVDAIAGASVYSDTTQITPDATTPATIVCTGVSITQPNPETASTAITVSASPSVTGLDLWFDVNRNRFFESTERYPMSKSGVDPLGRQQWKTSVATREPKQPWGIAGHQWYAQTAPGSGPTARCPADSFHSSDPNNRIRGYEWGPWLMNLSDTTWSRILLNAAKSIIQTGADGLFIDVAVTSPLMLSPDATASPRAIATYPADMKALLAAIKSAITPALLIFNGLSQAALPYADVTDGSMTEGFVAQPWKVGLANCTDWWGFMMDAELTVQATHNSTILNVGLGSGAPVSVRMYALASHLLVANTHTFYFYYANTGLAYYPEMDIDVGSPLQSFARVADAKRASGLYGRSYSGGLALVNSSDTLTLSETLPLPMALVTPNGGSIALLGGDGALSARWVTSITLPPRSGAVLLNAWSGSVGDAEVPRRRAPQQFTVGPNPLRTSMTLRATLPSAGRVRATLCTVNGRAVMQLADEFAATGAWTQTVNLRDTSLPAGVYLVRLDSPAGAFTRRVVVIQEAGSGR